jgi:hypothetical protein
MKTLLLTLTLIFSLSLAQADEGAKAKKHKNAPRAKITYSENRYKKTFAKRKNPKKSMFAGEGQVNGSRRFR